MKYLKYSFALLACTLLMAFTQTGKDQINITVQTDNCPNIQSAFLFEFNGVTFQPLQNGAVKEGAVKFQIPKTSPRFYYVGTAASNMKPVILGEENGVIITANCQKFVSSKVSASKINMQYDALKLEMNKLKQQSQGLSRKFQQMRSQPAQQQALIEQFAKLDNDQIKFMATQKSLHPYLGKVAGLNTYLSYQNNQADHANEIEYYGAKFFHFVNWADEDLEYMAWVFEGFKSFSTTLASIRLDNGKQAMYLDRVLAQIPADSRTMQLALGGILAGGGTKNGALYVKYGGQYIAKYKDTEPEPAAQVKVKCGTHVRKI